ncbi:DHA2 family efflux MFS transporter permease subunit [Aquiluna borgnonia]|uniref:DHA2 family efflux MFS transporter permease subunit n=1 Tax=Aquiluna borgnonia TaxID=2499157 RepID=A0A7D4QNQ2_9MICO|nr:DHA2 family efflux MFS transporter permease subunit [Aquiluna borgnonia]QKJ25807.1 DHA2 family efflux MFS transporter permease subunit [Aquiluna borgnonia]
MSQTKNRWVALLFISLAISLVIIDGTIVNTIFPQVIADLDLTSTEVQWVQESYVLVFASLLLVWGSLADRFGRKLMLVLGILVFVAASVWAGYTESAEAMILARVVQGVGGAMVLPTTLSLVNANFQGKERGIAFAVWGATIGGMVAVGPVLGGWLATDFTWRWAFLINLPLGIIIVAGLLYFLGESKSPQRAGGIDWVGSAISVVMFATLVFGLIEGRVYGWWEINPKNQFQIGDFAWPETGISVIPVSLAISAISTLAFILWERRRERQHKNVLLDLQLFSIASFRNGSIAATIISMGEFGVLFAIPLWLQNVLGLSPVSSGLVLLWLAGGAFMASGIGGALSGKLPAFRAVQIGVLLELVGVAGVGLFASTDLGWGAIAPALFIYGIGIGLATAQLTGVIMVDVPMDKVGQGSGSQSTVRQIGSALGIAVLGTVLFTGTQSSFEDRLSELNVSKEQSVVLVDAVVDSSGGAIPGLAQYLSSVQVPAEAAEEIQIAAGEAFTDGAKLAAWAAGAFLLLGFASTFRLGRKTKTA